jgi:hypothetical protein
MAANKEELYHSWSMRSEMSQLTLVYALERAAASRCPFHPIFG